MAKKEKPKKIEKIVKKFNKKITKNSSHIENLISDALKQFENLQIQMQEPIYKLHKDLEELRDREIKRFSDQFERQLQEFQEMQNNLLKCLGIFHADTEKSNAEPIVPPKPEAPLKVESEAKPTAVAETVQTPAPKAVMIPEAVKTPVPAPVESPITAPAPAPAPEKAKFSAKKTSKAAKLADPSDLTRVKGIGPATQKKMKKAGLINIGQIAYPSAEDEEKLKAFASMKGFDQLSADAKKIV